MSEKHYTQEAIDSQVPPNCEVLNQVAQGVDLETVNSPEIQQIIDRMYRVAYGRQGDAKYPTLVGLAAPQIGISKRVIIVGMNAVGGGEQPELQEFLNPELTKISDELEEGREGCFSTSRVCGVVQRPKSVTLRGYNRKGQTIHFDLEGFPARVAQHEVDHLDGIRFPDRITDNSKLHWVEEEEFGDYRQNWQTWSQACPREKWERIKSLE